MAMDFNQMVKIYISEPRFEISNIVVCATRKGSDQPAQTRSLIRAFASAFEYSTSVKLLTKHHLEDRSFKGGCAGSSESTLIKIPQCWKSHAAAQFLRHFMEPEFVPYLFGYKAKGFSKVGLV